MPGGKGGRLQALAFMYFQKESYLHHNGKKKTRYTCKDCQKVHKGLRAINAIKHILLTCPQFKALDRMDEKIRVALDSDSTDKDLLKWKEDHATQIDEYKQRRTEQESNPSAATDLNNGDTAPTEGALAMPDMEHSTTVKRRRTEPDCSMTNSVPGSPATVSTNPSSDDDHPHGHANASFRLFQTDGFDLSQGNQNESGCNPSGGSGIADISQPHDQENAAVCRGLAVASLINVTTMGVRETAPAPPPPEVTEGMETNTAVPLEEMDVEELQMALFELDTFEAALWAIHVMDGFKQHADTIPARLVEDEFSPPINFLLGQLQRCLFASKNPEPPISQRVIFGNNIVDICFPPESRVFELLWDDLMKEANTKSTDVWSQIWTFADRICDAWVQQSQDEERRSYFVAGVLKRLLPSVAGQLRQAINELSNPYWKRPKEDTEKLLVLLANWIGNFMIDLYMASHLRLDGQGVGSTQHQNGADNANQDNFPGGGMGDQKQGHNGGTGHHGNGDEAGPSGSQGNPDSSYQSEHAFLGTALNRLALNDTKASVESSGDESDPGSHKNSQSDYGYESDESDSAEETSETKSVSDSPSNEQIEEIARSLARSCTVSRWKSFNPPDEAESSFEVASRQDKAPLVGQVTEGDETSDLVMEGPGAESKEQITFESVEVEPVWGRAPPKKDPCSDGAVSQEETPPTRGASECNKIAKETTTTASHVQAQAEGFPCFPRPIHPSDLTGKPLRPKSELGTQDACVTPMSGGRCTDTNNNLFWPRPFRQTSEVSSITHSGYLFKRSNKPYQQVSPFPLDHLEISVGVQGDAIEAEIAPSIYPKPPLPEDPFFRDIFQSNGDNHQTLPHRPLHLPDPIVASLSSRFQETQDEQPPESMPLVPLLPAGANITGSISTRATEHEESKEPLITEAMQKKQHQLALEESLNSPAAFFGINVESAFEPPTQPSQSVTPSTSNLGIDVIAPPPLLTTNRNAFTQPQPLSPPCPPQQSQTKSVPTKMNLKRDSNGSFDYDLAVIHRRCSAPSICDSNALPPEGCTLDSNRSRPTDYIDPKDGHLWRAHYCILEDGILYFYPNAEDADSPDAKKERKTTVPLADDSLRHRFSAADSKDLSKSPMASRSLLNLPGADGSSAWGSNSDAESSFMWEKRVALNCVGAVRSTEAELGANVFELLAVDDEEDEGHTNKLVLKALQREEMEEWLFQLHRSLASFVRNVVDWVGAQQEGPCIQIPHMQAKKRYVPAHLRHAPPHLKYVPPHLREKYNGSPGAGGSTAAKSKKYVPPHLREKYNGLSGADGSTEPKKSVPADKKAWESGFRSFLSRPSQQSPVDPNQKHKPDCSQSSAPSG